MRSANFGNIYTLPEDTKGRNTLSAFAANLSNTPSLALCASAWEILNH